jgi:hypothetical protein
MVSSRTKDQKEASVLNIGRMSGVAASRYSVRLYELTEQFTVEACEFSVNSSGRVHLTGMRAFYGVYPESARMIV